MVVLLFFSMKRVVLVFSQTVFESLRAKTPVAKKHFHENLSKREFHVSRFSWDSFPMGVLNRELSRETSDFLKHFIFFNLYYILQGGR